MTDSTTRDIDIFEEPSFPTDPVELADTDTSIVSSDRFKSSTGQKEEKDDFQFVEVTKNRLDVLPPSEEYDVIRMKQIFKTLLRNQKYTESKAELISEMICLKFRNGYVYSDEVESTINDALAKISNKYHQ